MSDDRIHRAASTDGTEIAGRVEGTGPPLVSITGTGDGEGTQSLLPFLGEQFACYSMSLRGRGLSGDSPDHSPERLVEDVQAFVESIGEPVVVVGHSRGAALALQAAAGTKSVSAIAVFEPHVPELYSEDDVARVQDALERMRADAESGNLVDAARTFLEHVALISDDEMAVMASPQAMEPALPALPAIVRDISQWDLPRAPDLLPLDRVTAPVLLMQGTETHPFYTGVTRYLAEHLPQSRVHDMTGLGHLGPLFAPEPVAEQLKQFFSEEPVAA